jgi:hypothetical protein
MDVFDERGVTRTLNRMAFSPLFSNPIKPKLLEINYLHEVIL